MGIAGCGGDTTTIDDGECLISAGTYERQLSDAGGDCSVEMVEELKDLTNFEVEEDEDRECSERCTTGQDMWTTEDGRDCSYIVKNYCHEDSDEGLRDVETSVEVDCEGESLCEHDFEVSYKKQ